MRGWAERALAVALAVAGLGAGRAAPQPADPVVALHAGLVRMFAAAGGPSESAIEGLALKTFDMPAITLAVLGDAGKAATPAQRSRLSRVLVERLARQIVLGGRQSADDRFAIVAMRTLGGGEWLVTTREVRPTPAGGQPTPMILDWRVQREGAAFRIVDSLREGLSTVGVQHDDFAAALMGRDIDAVIDQMQRRAATPPAGM